MCVSPMNIHRAGKDIDLAKRHLKLVASSLAQAANILQLEKQTATPGSETAELLEYKYRQLSALEKVIMSAGNAAEAVDEKELIEF